MSSAPPTIFSAKRRRATRQRMLRQQDRDPFLLDAMVSDIIERLAFLRHEPKRILVIGDASSDLGYYLDHTQGSVVEGDIVGYLRHAELDLERPFPEGGFDFVGCLGLLDAINDLPGALIHIRNALAPGGRAIASFPGAGSLPALRRIMLAADADRPAARFHPLVDVRAGAQLLQRAGWADPVADSWTLTAAYRSLDKLVADLRTHGFGCALANHAPLGKAGLERARAAFAAEADDQGRVVESFEILTLSGRHP